LVERRRGTRKGGKWNAARGSLEAVGWGEGAAAVVAAAAAAVAAVVAAAAAAVVAAAAAAAAVTGVCKLPRRSDEEWKGS